MRSLIFLLVAAGLQAEYLRVEMDFGGLDCASCSDFIKNKLSKNPNVLSVDVDNKKGSLAVVLNPGNKMKFPLIRDFVQQSGYKITETHVTVVGQALMDTGRTKLKLSDNEFLFVKDSDASLRELITRKVMVSGTLKRVQTEDGPVDVLYITGAKHAQ